MILLRHELHVVLSSIHSIQSRRWTSGDMDADENPVVPWNPDRDHVNTLLDISEETFLNDQEAYELPGQGWDEVVQGWGRCPPFSCLLVAQQKSKKPKTEVSDPHCLLCTDVKHRKLSEFQVSKPGSADSSETADEPQPPGFCTPIAITTAATSPSESNAIKTNLPGDKAPLSGDLSPHSKTLQPLQSHSRNTGRVVSNYKVLPPVNRQQNPNAYSRLVLRPEVSGYDAAEEPYTSAVPGAAGSIQTGDDTRKYNEGSYSNSLLDTLQGSLPNSPRSRQPSGHLLCHLRAQSSRRPQGAVHTRTDTLPHVTSPLARNHRHVITPPSRQNWNRPPTSLNYRTLRRQEVELPKILGTRVAIPVSSQRLL